MRISFLLLFILLSSNTYAQNIIEWDSSYKLQLSDFQSAATKLKGGNVYSLKSSNTIDFAFSMSNAEFMFTKNFNSKVACSFRRDAAVLIAPDSQLAKDLLEFARYDFDLSELYARKFRKKLFEDKGAFSNVSFFKPLYDEIEQQYTNRYAMVATETDLGRDKEKLKSLHNEVLIEIAELQDFCKACKPSKKKKI
jgi:hypothetical protein